MENAPTLARRVVVLLPLLLAVSIPARAQVGTDTPAALLAFPYVVVDTATGRDTRIEISNGGDTAVDVRCYFQRVEGECIDGQPGEGCFLESPTCSGFCLNELAVSEWALTLAPHQPLGWLAGKGDAARDIAPLADLSIGPLRCLALPVGGQTSPNVLVGVAEVERVTATELDSAAYTAFGFRAVDGRPNGDGNLVLGGGAGEYRGCPDSIVLQNFFDGAQLTGAALDDAEVTTTIVTMPCGGDLTSADINRSQVLQYLAYNELAQRFSTSRRLQYEVRQLSLLDSNNPSTSIFNVAVQGVLTGQTYVHPASANESGVLALAIQRHRRLDGSNKVTTAIYGSQLEGEREQAETLVLPGEFPTVVPATPIETIGGATVTATVSSTPTPTSPANTPIATATSTSTVAAVATATGTSLPTATNPPQPTRTATSVVVAPTATATSISQTSGSSSGGGGCQTSGSSSGSLPLVGLALLGLVRSRRWRTLLLVLAIVAVGTASARAQLTGERGASIVSFPRVIAAENTDTVLQISTSSETAARAHCYYTNGATWEQTDFEITFQTKQSVHWLASSGKSDDPTFGNVPPLLPPFSGELVCIEISVGEGLPISGNSLRGSATVLDRELGVSRYAALGSRGFPTNDNDGVLCLGGQPRAGCPDGAEYEGCPQAWYLNHAVDGTREELQGEDSTSETILTVVPCSRDFLLQEAAEVTLSFTLTDEMEQQFSGTKTVSCWSSFPLSEVAASFAGTGEARYGLTTIRPAEGSGGFALTAEIVRRAGGSSTAASAAGTDVPRESSGIADQIVIPLETP